MNIKIMCLVCSGLKLTEPALDCLYRAAITLTKSKKTEMKFHHDDVYGIITTDYQLAQLAQTSGYVFDAEITTKEGSSTAKFLVRNSDLKSGKIEKGFWVSGKLPENKKNYAPHFSEN